MKWYNNLKIKYKLMTSFLLLSVVTGIVGVVGLYNMGKLNTIIHSLYNNETLGIVYIKEANADMLAFSRAFNNYLLTGSENTRSEDIRDMKNYRVLLSKNLDTAKPLIKSKEGKILISQFEQNWQIYKNEIYSVIDKGTDRDTSVKPGSIFKIEAALKQTENQMDSIFTEITKRKENDGKEYFMKSSTDYKNAKLDMMILLIFSLIIGTGWGIYISRIISRPINNLADTAKIVSGGNYNVKIADGGSDEIGKLAGFFAEMLGKIKRQLDYLEYLPTPVVIIDKEFNIDYINKFGKEFLGYKHDESFAGKKCYELFKTGHCQTDKCACSIAMAKDIITSAETVSAAKEKEQYILYSGAPVKDANGNIVGAIEHIADVNDLKNIQNYLSRSTEKMLYEIEKLSNGDLSINLIPERDDDDIAKLFFGLNKAVENMRDLISRVSEAIQNTASASNQISSSTEEMAAGAQEQSTQAGEVASAVEQMAKTIVETTRNASAAADASKKYGNIAKEGGNVVNDTINGMNRITDMVKSSAAIIKKLGENSRQIGEIVQVIEDIADQTNLLALNAAIEAARAGEQGRGFTVVADEVRKLSERTAKATKEISSMIKQIQSDTFGAVSSMEVGTKEVEQGKTLADKAGESLIKIISGADEVVNIISQVAAASEEQSAASEQISRNMEAISNVTQQSTAGVFQIAKAAEDLNRQTDNLEKLISRFKISGSNVSGYIANNNNEQTRIN